MRAYICFALSSRVAIMALICRATIKLVILIFTETLSENKTKVGLETAGRQYGPPEECDLGQHGPLVQTRPMTTIYLLTSRGSG